MLLKDLYGFKLLKNTVIERVFDKELNCLCYMVLVEREDYPMPIYVKFPLDFSKIKEVYPLLLEGDINLSLDVFKGNKDFNLSKEETLDYIMNKYSYLGYDLANIPEQVYFNYGNKIKRFVNGDGDSLKLDMEYTYLLGQDKISNCNFLSYKIRNFAKLENADYLYTYVKDGVLQKFILGVNYNNSKYNELSSIIESIN